jgi:hypothetical protein
VEPQVDPQDLTQEAFRAGMDAGIVLCGEEPDDWTEDEREGIYAKAWEAFQRRG